MSVGDGAYLFGEFGCGFMVGDAEDGAVGPMAVSMVKDMDWGGVMPRLFQTELNSSSVCSRSN